MPDLLRVVVLGIIQGITEFLPISSTGHLIVAVALLEYRSTAGGTFEIFIQLGSVFAVLLYYARDLWQQARAFPRDAQVRRFWGDILVAFIPAAVLGFLFGDWIDSVLFRPEVVALALIAGGVVFLLVERLPRHPAQTTDVTHISLRQALGVGLIQTLALIPGVSRSGASIVGGMAMGLSREVATRFAFYLAIPTLGAATLYALYKALDTLTAADALGLGVGLLVAGVVSWFAIGWLLRYVSQHTFVAFGWYRIAAGIVILALVISGILKT